MNKIQEVKQRADIIKVAEHLGIKLNRANKCNCIWHDEKTASLSFSQSRQIFHCFGCGVTGDCITLVSKLLNINAYEAAKQINSIFSLGIDFGKTNSSKFEINRQIQIQKARERFYKWHNETLQLLCDYLHSLSKIERLQKQEMIEYYIDLLIFGTKKIGCGLRKQKKGGVKKLNEELEKEMLKKNPPDIEKLDKENILEDAIFDYLISLPNSPDKIRIIEKIRERAKELKIIQPFNI